MIPATHTAGHSTPLLFRFVMGATLEHRPALDGLRGLAVVSVVAYHGGVLEGGWIGVDVFFVLSGYLITSLLLTEHETTGRIELTSFWRRRVRRLLPGLAVCSASSLYSRSPPSRA